MEAEGPIIKEPRVLLKIIETACDAIIACSRQLNVIDSEFGNGDYGTVLSCAAGAIKKAIKNNQLSAARPYTIFSKMGTIVEEATDSPQGQVYSLFFYTVAKSFLAHEKSKEITPHMWQYALNSFIQTISINAKLAIGDRCILDALVPAALTLSEKLREGMNPLDAFGEAVKAAEISAARTVHIQPVCLRQSHSTQTPRYPAAEAHAVGIWMRGACEAMKLALI